MATLKDFALVSADSSEIVFRFKGEREITLQLVSGDHSLIVQVPHDLSEPLGVREDSYAALKRFVKEACQARKVETRTGTDPRWARAATARRADRPRRELVTQ